jgi:hypothetical protein
MGPYFILYGKDFEWEQMQGAFLLASNDMNNHIAYGLVGLPNGTLTWDNNDLGGSAIVAKSLGANGYIKYASGLILQWWSNCTPTYDSTSTIITFPILFSYWNHYAITVSSNGFSTVTVDNTYHNASNVKLKHSSVSSSVNAAFDWIAIGYY